MTMSRCRILGRITSQGQVSARGGRTAAARPRNGGVDGDELRLRGELRGGANQERNVERVADSGSDSLSKRGAKLAGGIRHAAHIDFQIRLSDAGEMTQFVIHSTLLRRQQQQQQTQCFVHVGHSVGYGWGIKSWNANRIGSILQPLWYHYNDADADVTGITLGCKSRVALD